LDLTFTDKLFFYGYYQYNQLTTLLNLNALGFNGDINKLRISNISSITENYFSCQFLRARIGLWFLNLPTGSIYNNPKCPAKGRKNNLTHYEKELR